MNTKQTKFKFKYSPVVWVLLALVLILSAAGLVWNVYALTQSAWEGAIKIFSYSAMILITLILICFVLGVMLYGRYVLTDKYLIQYFVLIKIKTPIDSVVQITHFKKSDKLVVYFDDQKYTVIVIDKCYYDAFILSLRNVNSKVVYDVQIDGEDTPE